MRLRLLPGDYAVCRLADDALAPPPPRDHAAFWSLTVAAGERSLVCPQDEAPDAAAIVSGGWRILMVQGPMDLGLTGVMASLAGPLAGAGVPIFPIATHDTDWILVPAAVAGAAAQALRDAGHDVDG